MQLNGKMVGSLGNIDCFSFYGNKIFSCGEGELFQLMMKIFLKGQNCSGITQWTQRIDTIT